MSPARSCSDAADAPVVLEAGPTPGPGRSRTEPRQTPPLRIRYRSIRRQLDTPGS
ncbi:hypothetical protein GCM10009738_47540 [Kitasatospora viridis]